tara:strand:- start:1043 stop:1267 length:225 start_codon:yes stop_codon:yes gene_type:complete
VKLSKLKFVDGKRFKRGIDMDVNNQLLSVALKTGAKPDFVAMDQGVDAAGYVAVEWFTLEEGKLKAHLFRKVGE